MALFTVFTFKRGKPDVEAIFRDLTSAAHIHPTSVLATSRRFGRRTIHVHALMTPTGFYRDEDQTSITDQAATLMNGYVFDYSSSEPRTFTAAEIGKQFSISNFDNWGGIYSVARVKDGRVTALADPDGLQNLFYVDTPDVFAVSTRPALLALLANISEVDTTPLAWISAIGYRVGNDTAYKGIKAIPQGSALIWDGKTSFVSRRTALNREHADGIAGRPSWFATELDKAVHASANAVQLACRGEDQIELAITGGKDSRLVLAMCLAAGLRDRLLLYTNGPSDHPDVIVGEMIANAVGLPHRKNSPGAVETTFVPAWKYIDQIQAFSYQADGLSGSWNNFLTRRTGRDIRMGGLMGEVLKAYAKRPFDPSKPLNPLDMVKLQGPFDPMGVLRSETKRALANDIRSKMDEHLRLGFTNADLPDLFYYANRIPNWLGGMRQVQPYAFEKVMPIGVPPLMRMAFAATADERKTERIHFEAIKKLAPNLIDIPFAMQTWHKDLPTKAVEAIARPPGTTTPVHGTWQHSINHDLAVRNRVIQCIRDNPVSSVWSVVDADALIARVGKGGLGMLELISLLGILPSLMFAERKFSPVKVESDAAPIPYEWNPVQHQNGWWRFWQ